MRNDAAALLISPPPLGDTCCHCTIHRLCSHQKHNNREKKFIKKSQRSDRTNPKYIFRGRLVSDTHAEPGGREHSFIFGQICRNRQSPWCGILTVISFKLQHQSTQWRSLPLSIVYHLTNAVARAGFVSAAIDDCSVVVINIWGYDDSLCREVSRSVGVCCQIIPVVGIDY